MTLINALVGVSILGIAMTSSMQVYFNLAKINEINLFDRDVSMLVKQQEKIKEKEGFYYEFGLDTKENHSYNIDGYVFYVSSPNTTIDFKLDAYDSDCINLVATNSNLEKKKTWNSCYQLAIITESL